MHFYLEYLVHAAECLSELHYDTLRNVRTVKLDIGSYGAATLPCDYLDFCRIGVEAGQSIKPLTQNDSFNRLNNYENGQKVPFSTDDAGYFIPQNFVWYNDKGEFTGRMYGGGITSSNTYKILKERNEIQFHNDIKADSIILEYISDGSETDNLTKVHPYAKMTIEAYINWKYKENGRSFSDGERHRAMKLFEHERAILRGRLNDITIEDIKSIMRKNTHGTIK